MTLRDILERAHCCDEMLAFASICQYCNSHVEPCIAAWPHMWQHVAPATWQGGHPKTVWPRFYSFADLWDGIERHDWLTWLMRHCPDQFEDSWRDATSALHAMADALEQGKCTDCGASKESINTEACHVIRQYVRLRS